VSSSDFLYLNVLDISNNPIIDVQEDVFYTYRNLTVVRMSNLQVTGFRYKNSPDDYSIKMLESYFESNIILQLDFSGKKYVSFCSIGVELNALGIRKVNKLGWNCFGRFEGLRTLTLNGNTIDDTDVQYKNTSVILEYYKLYFCSPYLLSVIPDTVMSSIISLKY